MNAKDQLAMDTLLATMKADFTATLKSVLQEHVDHIIALEQRSSNFAARVSASNKIMRAEITALRAQVEALTPTKAVPSEPRISAAQWDAAVIVLKNANPGKTFFAPGLVRACAKEMAEHARAYKSGQADYDQPPTAYVQACIDADEEVTL